MSSEHMCTCVHILTYIRTQTHRFISTGHIMRYRYALRAHHGHNMGSMVFATAGWHGSPDPDFGPGQCGEDHHPKDLDLGRYLPHHAHAGLQHQEHHAGWLQVEARAWSWCYFTWWCLMLAKNWSNKMWKKTMVFWCPVRNMIEKWWDFHTYLGLQDGCTAHTAGVGKPCG